ncbi:MAG: hypothetical protein ACFFE1_12170 [Candidatus Thorarchaeota archaeon]
MKNKRIRLFVVFLTTLLFLTCISTIEVPATVVFHDDFQDGNMDGWTVALGNFTIAEYATGEFALLSGRSNTIGQYVWNSTPVMTEGTWSFDYYHFSYSDIWIDFHFFINGTLIDNDIDGYMLEITHETGPYSLRLIRIEQGSETLLKFGIIPEGFAGTWTHFDITRNATNGEMNVWMNGTWALDAMDTTFNRSEKFVFFNFKGGPMGNRVVPGIMLDNLIIDDQITIFPPEPTPTVSTSTEPSISTTTSETTTPTGNGEPFVLDPMLLAVGGGVIILLVVIVVIMKRK